MKEFVVNDPVTFLPGVLIGMTAAQHSGRAQCLQAVDVKGLPRGIAAYCVQTRAQFKAGEIVYLSIEKIDKTPFGQFLSER